MQQSATLTTLDTRDGEPEERVVDEQHHRAPNLQELDEQQAQRFLTELFSNLSAQHEYAIRHEDYVMQMPQSGESIRGRQRMREFQEAYPSPPSIQLRRVIVKDGLWLVEGVNDYGVGQAFTVVLIIELKDGKMWRGSRHHPGPLRAPGGGGPGGDGE